MTSASETPYMHGSVEHTKRLPAWLRRSLATPGQSTVVEGILGELQLHTVCRSAKCPNRGECFSKGTATFLVMGDVCTRGCRFCAVKAGQPKPLDADEPRRIAEAVCRMHLSHVVLTMVARDDLGDGGAAHLVAVIEAVREAAPHASVEVLASDFAGNLEAVDKVAAARPAVFNHNLETVPRLYESVRPGAVYKRSLAVLRRATAGPNVLNIKSGLMLGLGESIDEVIDVMQDLRKCGVTMLTLGQYLRPSPAHLPVASFVRPDVFASLEREARAMGFASVASAPFVRSSYHAGDMVRGDQFEAEATGKTTI